jgi:hypothetical protein
MATIMVVTVSVLALAIAGKAMLDDVHGKLKLCTYVYRYVDSLKTTIQGDKRVLPVNIRRYVIENALKFQDFMAKTCPKGFDQPEKPQKPSEMIHDIMLKALD